MVGGTDRLLLPPQGHSNRGWDGEGGAEGGAGARGRVCWVKRGLRAALAQPWLHPVGGNGRHGDASRQISRSEAR